MIRNTLTTSIRFILKSRLFTAINLIGLTAGLTASFFLLVYIINEFSYNKSFPDSRRIFRVVAETNNGTTPFIPSLIAEALFRSNPEIHYSALLSQPGYFFGTALVTSEAVTYPEPGIISADTGILTILGVNLLQGTCWTTAPEGSGIIISETTSKKYFGKTDPVGKVLEADIGGYITKFIVTGVFYDLPWNTTLQIDLITGQEWFRNLMKAFEIDHASEVDRLEDDYQEAWLKINSEDDLIQVEASFPEVLEQTGLDKNEVRLSLQSVRDIHLYSGDLINDPHFKGNRKLLFYYTWLAIFVLLLAGINYSILSTARSALRFKEVGVRKVLGATGKALRIQLLAESMLLTFLSLPLSFLALGLIEPFVDQLYGYDVRLYTWNMLIYIPVFTGITLLIGLLSGAYLAGYLASLNPLKAIRNQITRYKKISFSRAFTIFQLFITITLLICLAIMITQLRFATSSHTGIEEDELLIVPLPPEGGTRYIEFRDSMKRQPFVQSVSGSSIIPPTEARNFVNLYVSDTTTDYKRIELYYVDSAFFQTLGVPFLEGGDFPSRPDSLTGTPLIMNEKTRALLRPGFSTGAKLMQYQIVGVVKDFSIHSFYEDVNPALFVYQPEFSNYIIIRYLKGKEFEKKKVVETIWQQFFPEIPLVYNSYSEELNRMYKKEIRFSWVVSSFTLMAFLITGMGLFGLALLLSERKMKETMIRKVYGASDLDILSRMMKEFLLYTVISSLMAIPAAWFLMSRWLSTFAIHTPMHWYIFFLAILISTLFVSFIILGRTYRVLHQQPMNALRYE